METLTKGLEALEKPANDSPAVLQALVESLKQATERINKIAPTKPEDSEPKALGGRVLQGISYIGGERGMELFTPAQDGWVTPNDQLRQLAARREAIVTRTVAMQGGNVHHHHNNRFSINVQVPNGSAAVEDPRELARLIAHEVDLQRGRA